ncbi:MAG: 6-phosphogluconolactonase [Pseudomonadota bacterium]
MSHLTVFASYNELAMTLSHHIMEALELGIKKRGSAVMAVSGGSTPLKLYESLSQTEFPWEKVTITLTDERWVDNQSSDSNEKAIYEHLLINHARVANFIPLKNVAQTAKAGELACHNRLSSIQIPFDYILLGMGTDGHTASLFPCAAETPLAMDLQTPLDAKAIQPTSVQQERMTLTLPRILRSERMGLLLTGETKKSLLDKINHGPEQSLPVEALIKQQQTPLDIFYSPH